MQQHYPGIDPHLFYFLPFLVIFTAVASIIMIIPYWMIFKKAGFSPWLSLLFFVPLANIIVLYVVAFSQWKVVPVTELTPAYRPPYPGPAQPLPPIDPNYRS